MKKFIKLSLFIIASLSSTNIQAHKPPKLAIIFVIDQLGYQFLEKVKHHFNDGLNFFLKKGVQYANAHHPHAKPATAVGHTALSTGTWPKYHGIIDNEWHNEKGEVVNSDDDANLSSAQFAPNGALYTFGKSAVNMMVDNLSDQIMISSEPNTPHEVYALSIKSRAAIAMAGKAGKALWLDDKSGQFTSSRAYFGSVPAWVQRFNREHKNSLTTKWYLRYPQNSKAYNFDFIRNYENTETKSSLIGKTFSFHLDPKKWFGTEYLQTPAGNQLLLDFATSYIMQTPLNNPDKMTVLWISLSPLDLLGHIYGPESIESIDMLYHLDKQIGEFLKGVYKKVDRREVFLALTADHGVVPFIENTKKKGYSTARRINSNKIIEQMNDLVMTKYGVPNIVRSFKAPQFYLDEAKLQAIDHTQRAWILHDLQHLLSKQPGIRNVWRRYELVNSPISDPDDFMYYYKNQIYPGRSGHLFVLTEPYVDLSPYPTGTSHRTPYHYDTQVPLILYQQGRFENKVVMDKVWTLQFPVTLSHILQVPKPSASTFEALPGLKLK